MNLLTIRISDDTTVYMSVPLSMVLVAVSELSEDSAIKVSSETLMVSAPIALSIIEAQRNNQDLTIHIKEKDLK